MPTDWSLDEKEHQLIDRYPSKKQRNYGLHDYSDINYSHKSVDWNAHFNILNAYKYGGQPTPDYSKKKPKKVQEVDKTKITHNNM